MDRTRELVGKTERGQAKQFTVKVTKKYLSMMMVWRQLGRVVRALDSPSSSPALTTSWICLS